MGEETFTVNRNPGHFDVVHSAHPGERCNTDDAKRLKRGVTFAEAATLINEKGATACRWCFPNGLQTSRIVG